jgi:hypothetical protein
MAINNKEMILNYDFVKHEFEDVGENINEDLSTIRITLTRDIHTESVDLEICIYGKDHEVDSDPIVQNLYSGKSDIFDAGMLRTSGAVAPYKVLSLFDQRLLDLFTNSKIKIHWNEGDDTHAEIDPSPKKNIGLLFVQDQ